MTPLRDLQIKRLKHLVMIDMIIAECFAIFIQTFFEKEVLENV